MFGMRDGTKKRCARRADRRAGGHGDFASHKSTAICWRHQKAKGITKRGQHPLKGAVLSYSSIFPLIKSGSIASRNSAKY